MERGANTFHSFGSVGFRAPPIANTPNYFSVRASPARYACVSKIASFPPLCSFVVGIPRCNIDPVCLTVFVSLSAA